MNIERSNYHQVITAETQRTRSFAEFFKYFCFSLRFLSKRSGVLCVSAVKSLKLAFISMISFENYLVASQTNLGDTHVYYY